MFKDFFLIFFLLLSITLGALYYVEITSPDVIQLQQKLVEVPIYNKETKYEPCPQNPFEEVTKRIQAVEDFKSHQQKQQKE